MAAPIRTLTFRPKFAWWVKPALGVAFLIGGACPKCADKMIEFIVDRGLKMDPM